MRVAGFGFRAGASPESLRAALRLALDRAGLQAVAGSLTLIAAPRDKAGADCIQALAASLDLPVVPVAPGEMPAMATLTESARVRAARGTGSVAEAAALAAARQFACGEPVLVHPRVISPDRLATCAIARFMPVQGTRP